MTARERNEVLREHTYDQIKRMRAAWPAHTWERAYIAELGRALLGAADTPGDVTAAVDRAIDQHPGRYPPPIADVRRYAAEHRRARLEREAAEERARRRARGHHAREEWRGWLAWAAHVAHRHDVGDPPEKVPAELRPYLELVFDLGYRNHHGCGEHRDADGHLHPADPDHDPVLAAAALEGAERIWRAGGRLPAPGLTVIAGGLARHEAGAA